jgi:hypothetical protein
VDQERNKVADATARFFRRQLSAQELEQLEGAAGGSVPPPDGEL